MAVAQKLNEEYISEKVEELPTLPTIVYELTQVINDPMSSTKDVESIMENDQAMTTKVLKLVNSAYYAIPGGVSNLARAIELIGDRWTLLILRSALYGVRRFDDFQEELGTPRTVLSSRLNDLVDAGLLDKKPYKLKGRRARSESACRG